jgi:hypothetical protein
MPGTTTSGSVSIEPITAEFGGPFRLLYEYISHSDVGGFFGTLETWWNVFSIIAIFIALLFFAGFVYAKIRYGELSEIEQNALKDSEARWAARNTKTSSANTRWEAIQQRVSENTPEAWRIAIIEADIMLDETLTNAGYVGQTLGEKLKSANPQSFTTIQDAWEAHKVRNEIAHVGSDFVLTKKNAQETLVRFERVFREFGVI